MLRKNSKSGTKAAGGSFAIVASKYNARYVDAMVKSAHATLKRAGAEKIDIIRVPGAFEIPVVAARLADARPGLSAIICLGVILRGETTHAEHIGLAVSQGLMDLQVRHGIPVVHEVLLLENKEQARVRCLGGKYDRGTEAAQTALEMAKVIAGLSGED